MKRFFLTLFFLCLTLVSFAQDLPNFSDLPRGEWTNIPVEGAQCLYGTPYSFFVRPADEPTDKLMVYFEGGGACWDGVTCASKGEFASVYEVTPDKMSFYTNGFFDYDNEANPVRDYNAVLVPYCSGDVHAGNAEVTFEVPAGSVEGYTEPSITVPFNGFSNASSVLDWVYQNIVAPSQVFISGCSAGGYGAVFHTANIMENYANIPAVMLSDASNGVTPSNWEGFTTWNILDGMPSFIEGLANISTEDYNTTVHILEMAKAFPENRFAQYNAAIDGVQVSFYALMTQQSIDAFNFALVAQQWGQGLQENLNTLETEAPNFLSYTAGGLTHCVTMNDITYTFTVDDFLFADWVRGLLDNTTDVSPACDITKGECFTDPTVAGQ